MVAIMPLVKRAMSDQKKSERETGNYRLYRDTMDKIVEIAGHKKKSVAEFLEPMLAAIVDAEYMAILNEKLEAEQERQRRFAEVTKQKKDKK